jgi:TRAP transporter TAXI family solute receptor
LSKYLRQVSLRDLFLVVMPLVLLAALAFWAAAQFIKPAPPSRMVLSTGGEAGAYHRFGALYKDVLARYGVELVLTPSAGASENLVRLRDGSFDVDAAFVQSGTARYGEADELESLGQFYHEPVWVFYRAGLASQPIEDLRALKGRRIAIGAAGSGTQHLARELLAANEMNAENTRLVEDGSLALVEKLSRGEIDAVITVGPTQSGLVWSLLYTKDVRLMNIARAAAYVRRFPHLAELTLPRGAIDLVRDIPAEDVRLLAPMATLLVRSETHPALIDLLMQAAAEVHGAPGVFQRQGEFPRAGHSDFPLSKEADRFYKSGKPFLQRYLPFWAATLVDRMVVMLVPLLAVLVPLFKFAPSLYGWRVRSRIYKRYGELKFLESELDETPQRHSREEWLQRLDAIERGVNRMPTPLAFADMLYTLRVHIRLVRDKLATAVPPEPTL